MESGQQLKAKVECVIINNVAINTMSKIKDELYEIQEFKNKELEAIEPKGKINEVRIQIIHQLTPFHKQSFEEMLESTMKALYLFWSNKSTKLFEIRTIKK